MRYFDKAFFKFLIGLLIFIALGLAFIGRVHAGLIDINTAGLAELETLSGIGPSKAQAIVDYREQNGLFGDIEEIKNVGGIGEATYTNIRDFITVYGTEEGSGQGESEDHRKESSPASPSKREKAQELTAGILGEKISVVNAPVAFEAEANIASLKKGDYTWSFGDGGTGFGPKVSHTYLYPGEYVTVLRVRSQDGGAVARASVKVVPATFRITSATSERIEVENFGSMDADLYGRSIVDGGRRFEFPADMIIKAGQKISFPSAITGLGGADPRVVLAIEPVVPREEPDRARIAEIEDEILSLQMKQMELRRAETEAGEQLALPVKALEAASSAVQTEEKKDWFSTLKKFFGFR